MISRIKALFNREGRWLTNGSGTYIECHVGYYLMTRRTDNAPPKLAKVKVDGDARQYFPTWKPITKSKWEKETEAVRASWLPGKEEVQMDFVFECNGLKYYTIKADMMPAGRFYQSQLVLDELQCGMSAETQQAYRDAVLKAVDEGKLGHIAILTNEQNTRAKIAMDADVLTKLASILIVGEDEPLDTYDVDYNRKKVADWRKYMGDTFFLSAPVKSILPFSNMSTEEMELRMKMAVEVAQSSLLKKWLKKSKKG